MKDTRLKIGVDLDGVVCNWLGTFRKLVKAVTGREMPETCTTWNQHDWGITREEWQKAWDMLIADEWSYIEMAPCMDVSTRHGGFNLKLFALQHQAFFITTRPQTAGLPMEIQSAMWLQRQYGIDYPTVLVTSNKGPISAALQLDAFIDDKPENLHSIGQHVPGCRLFLRDATYNQNADGVLTPGSYQRVYSFAEFAAAMGTQLL